MGLALLLYGKIVVFHNYVRQQLPTSLFYLIVGRILAVRLYNQFDVLPNSSVAYAGHTDVRQILHNDLTLGIE